MKIAILSQKASLYSTRRLKEAGEQRGHEMKVIDYLRCYMNITSHQPTVVYQGKQLEDFNAIILASGHRKLSTALLSCGSLKSWGYSRPIHPKQFLVPGISCAACNC